MQLDSRSSTESLRSGSSPNNGYNNGPHNSSAINTLAYHLNTSNSGGVMSNRKCSPLQTASGSLKKRVAPLPPPSESNEKLTVTGHVRNLSDSRVSLPVQRASRSRSGMSSRKSLVSEYSATDKKKAADCNNQSATHLRKY